MTHEQAREQLSAFVDEELGASEMARMEEHLQLCEECRLEAEEIAGAIRHAYWQEKQIVEGGGSVGIAAILAGKIAPSAGPTCVVLSGCNIDLPLHHRIIGGEDLVL